MISVVYGGSGSGKSEYAESLALKYLKRYKGEGLIYLAAMKPYGDEAFKRIERHKRMRYGKGFETIECYTDLKNADISKNSVVLLECMSNLAANEIFEANNKDAVCDILEGIKKLNEKCSAVVIVTNDVFSDGLNYTKETIEYIKALGEINMETAKIAENVVEVVCSIPLIIKGGE